MTENWPYFELATKTSLMRIGIILIELIVLIGIPCLVENEINICIKILPF